MIFDGREKQECLTATVCTVKVSWIRKHDLHVLTSGESTFTGDNRFSAHHDKDESLGATTGSHSRMNFDLDVWTLQIKFTRLTDAGEYQCQVNSEPKISISVFLNVSGELTDTLNVFIRCERTKDFFFNPFQPISFI